MNLLVYFFSKVGSVTAQRQEPFSCAVAVCVGHPSTSSYVAEDVQCLALSLGVRSLILGLIVELPLFGDDKYLDTVWPVTLEV